jgi:RNA polymerase sigma factor (sigma-70 family)
MTPSFEEDRQLILKCLSGDRNALETLVRRFSNLVYHTVRSTFIAKHAPFNAQDLEDLHNTVFLGLFEGNCAKLRSYQGRNGCSPASWIRIVTVRMVLNHLRKKGVDSAFGKNIKTNIDDLFWLPADVQEPLALMEAAERRKLVHEAMESLAPRDRLFSRLHFEQGLPLEQVAEVLGISVNNASVLKNRIIEKLKEKLKAYLVHLY